MSAPPSSRVGAGVAHQVFVDEVAEGVGVEAFAVAGDEEGGFVRVDFEFWDGLLRGSVRTSVRLLRRRG